MTIKSKILLIFSAILSLALTNCMYTPSVHQGKTISTQQIQSLKINMTKQQVKTMLGAPTMPTPNNPQQWTYVQYTYHQNSQTNQSVSLTFSKKDRLIKIETTTPKKS